ncbi:DUF6456 domain-containing protein [Oceanicaulis sp. MMSF_3324]|uniref:DUF6456 domain-containing protein n=1 Tax=Oceanicaulis sp. MMSF_3324 TaxID=3046702 RepID=UPI00273DE9B9|nr:DUF6456 domain-containing protein [Oceanicaulis sp. MMSF_3324]
MSPAWMRRLMRKDAVLAPLAGGKPGYGVYASGDRRRRPLTRLSRAAFDEAVAHGWLTQMGEGAYGLSVSGRRAAAEEGDAPRPALSVDRRSAPDPDGGVRVHQVNLHTYDGPLLRYARPRKGQPPLLEPAHLSAADSLMRDYELSSLSSRVTQDWSGLPGGSGRSAPRDRSDAPLKRMKAQERVMDALAAVGPGLDHWLVEILIRQSAMTDAERRLNWPTRSGAQALKLALDRLAIHYRLKPERRAADPFGR